jgi:hypothetical protein
MQLKQSETRESSSPSKQYATITVVVVPLLCKLATALIDKIPSPSMVHHLSIIFIILIELVAHS